MVKNAKMSILASQNNPEALHNNEESLDTGAQTTEHVLGLECILWDFNRRSQESLAECPCM